MKSLAFCLSSSLLLVVVVVFILGFLSSSTTLAAAEEGGVAAAGGIEGAGGAAETEGRELQQGNQVLCVCRCCFHGDCSYISNASWLLDDCSSCNAGRCQDMILSAGTRKRISKTFGILNNLEEILSVDGADRQVMLRHSLQTLNENRWDVCEVTAMVETVTCLASSTPSGCQSSADLSAICFDRNAAVVKYGTWVFLILIVGGVVFAFIKNHLIGCQEFNQGAFDY